MVSKLDNSISNDISGADQVENDQDIENYKQQVRTSVIRVS